MIIPSRTSSELDKTLARLDREHVLVIELGELGHLLVRPDTEPFAPQPGPSRPGVVDLAATLTAAKTLPHELTVRICLPHGVSPEVPITEAQAALRSRAAHLATVAWREAMAVRNMGRRQLPLGIVIALVSWVFAYVAASAISSSDSGVAIGLLAATAAILLTIAWVVSWMVIETRYFDWRLEGRRAAAYELIARCALEITDHHDG